MELLNDRSIEEQFHTLVKKFLTKNDNYDVKRFIGGMPLTLERKDVYRLMTKNSQGQRKYTVTQKVDGSRTLLYIGPDMKTQDYKQRVVTFIDRNMKIYTIRNNERAILPYVNTREMLLDGELIFFDKEGVSHKELESSRVKGVSFMAFDMLFGPETIDFSSGKKIIGQEFSMIVPEDGNLRTLPWYYSNRYSILSNLILPTSFNNFEPILTEAFKGVPWFNIELKPIYPLDILKNDRLLYTTGGTGFLQRELSKSRKNFYEMLKEKYKKTISVFIEKTVKLDGLIFTSDDTLYTIGNWDKLMSAQYKWKPAEEQTVDFLVKKTSPTKGDLYVSIGRNVKPYQRNYQNVSVTVPESVISESVSEFSIVNGNFIFKEVRVDKTLPNSIKTVIGVINSFKDPVNINELYYFLNIETVNPEGLKLILSYSTRDKLLQCVAVHSNLSILESREYKLIEDMIKQINVNKEIEVELRLGIKKDSFSPNVPRTNFTDTIKKLQSFNFKMVIDDFVDIYADKIRTRHVYSKDFRKYIFLESIIKNRISNVDVISKQILNFDIRVAMSSEVNIKQYNTSGEATRKYRISFLEPNNLFRVDLTAITQGTFKDRLFIQGDNKTETFQIEIELMSEKIDINALFKFVSSMLSA
jgi:hypothetical protein